MFGMQCSVGALVLGLFLAVRAGAEPALNLSGWFATSDQQAQRYFSRGEFVKAAERFTDPMRQGMAWYRAGQFDRAAGAFGRTGTVEGLFNRGNAQVLMGDYAGAMATYANVLEQKPGWQPAIGNMAVARARLEKLTPADDAPPQKGVGEDDEPDDIVFDDRARNRTDANEETVTEAMEALNDKALRALWLRRVESRPGEFLKRKFAYQHSQSAKTEASRGAEE